MKNLTELAKNSLDKMTGFISANNYNVIVVDKNYCELEGIVTESSMNHLGIVHGGYIFGLADTAAGIAAMSEGNNVVTVDANINYFKPAKSEKIFAKAKAIKVGKTISVYEVLISDKEDNLLAKSTVTFFVIK